MANAVVVRIVGEVQDLRAKLGQASNDVESFGKRAGNVFKSAFGDLSSIATSRFGAVGGEAKKALDSVAGDAASSGSALGLGVAGGAAVAAAGLAKLAADGVQSFVTLASQIRNLQRETGASAEDASRLNATFQALGVDAEQGGKAIFLLSKNIDTNAQKLQEHGIAIARDKQGHVDLYQTLLNVRDAYQAAGQGAEGNAIASAAFGRSGLALLPVLAATRDRLDEINSSAKSHDQFLSQDEVDRAKQFQIAMEELHQAVGGLERALGEGLVPILTGTANALDRVITDVDHAAKGIGGIGGIVKGVVENMLPGTSVLEMFAGGSKKAGDATAAAGAAMDTTATSADTLAASVTAASSAQKLYTDALNATVGERIAQVNAASAVADAEQKLTDDLRGQSDQLAATTAQAKTYQDVQAELVDSVVGVDEAHVRARDAVRALNDELHKGAIGSENAAAYMKRYYDHGSAAADDHGDRVSGAAAQAVSAAEAEVDAMAKSGEIADTAAARKQALSEKLIALKTQFPEVATQIDRYIARLSQVPNLSTHAADSTTKLAKTKRDLAKDTADLVTAAENEASHEGTVADQHRKLIELLEAEKKKYPELAGAIEDYIARANAAYATQWGEHMTAPMGPYGQWARHDFATSQPASTGSTGSPGSVVSNVVMNIFGAGDDPVTIGTVAARQLGWASPIRGRM